MDKVTAVSSRVSSLLTLANTAIGMEQDAKDDHCYAINDEKRSCLEGRDKDHNYSTISKRCMGHRKKQRYFLSALDIFSSAESEKDYLETSYLHLPHYESNDSALDVTGFDTISRKCISYENIDMKTVDVSTDRCILPGTSDPDISRMTLGSSLHLDTHSLSVPNSPPLSELRTTLEHNYSKDNVFQQLWNYRPTKHQWSCDVLDISPLFDHSYNSSKDDKHLMHTGIKHGKSTEKVDKIHPVPAYSQTFTKSPFIDHTYQSLSSISRGEMESIWRKERTFATDKVFPKTPFLDHSYDTAIDTDDQMDLFSPLVRNRSSSFSAVVSAQDIFRSDHSYVIKKQDDTLSMSCGSDSGTESFTEDTADETPPSSGSLVSLQKDHAYVTHIELIISG